MNSLEAEPYVNPERALLRRIVNGGPTLIVRADGHGSLVLSGGQVRLEPEEAQLVAELRAFGG